jgi:PRC-barrel domain
VSTPEPQVSWKALEQDATVVTSDGDESGRVVEIVGDPDADIFNGLVVSLGVLDKNRHLPAERVQAIWPKRIEVESTLEELKALPPYEEPVVETLEPAGGFFTRLRNLFR